MIDTINNFIGAMFMAVLDAYETVMYFVTFLFNIVAGLLLVVVVGGLGGFIIYSLAVAFLPWRWVLSLFAV